MDPFVKLYIELINKGMKTIDDLPTKTDAQKKRKEEVEQYFKSKESNV